MADSELNHHHSSETSRSDNVKDDMSTSQPSQPHPRSHIPAWKWKCSLVVIYLTCIINGYDVSNVANIQPRLYEAFGHIDILPWIALSYSLANFAVLSLARKVIYCFDMRIIYLINLIIFIAGAAISGSANSMGAVIGGRIIMGIGGAIVQQCNTSYFAVLATPDETPKLFGIMSGLWATGLVVGGPIGSALAENEATTWRWAFYMNLPFVGLGFVLAIFCIPSLSLAPPISLWHRLLNIDPVGITLHIASAVLFAIAVTFSGPVWDWGSTASIVVWVVFGVVFLFWAVQQFFCLFTTAEQRSFPVHLLSRTDLLPIWTGQAMAGASYAVTLYYTPLFLAFARGLDALEQTVRLLPFILTFIVTVILTGGSLPKIGRYNLIYILGGAFTLAGGVSLAIKLDLDTSESTIMGLTALIGVGLGMHFQHGTGISNVINKDQGDRVDSVAIMNMSQMGGIAVMLAVAGNIFQNVGYNLLHDAIGDQNFSQHEIREALAGVSSAVWQSDDPRVLRRGLEAVAKVLAREFWIVAACGGVAFVAGFLMRWEKLDYSKKAHESEDETKA